MNMNQKMRDKENSIKHLRIQLENLTKELDKTTGHLQLLEIRDELNSKIMHTNSESEQEISELIRKQNTISHEIIEIRKRIQRLSAKTILKVELIVLPMIVTLLFYIVTNYVIPPSDHLPPIKTHYFVENLRGNGADDYNSWSLSSGTGMVVNIENNIHASKEKIDAIKKTILSTNTITDDNSLSYQSASGSKSKYFIGWQGALDKINNTKHQVPKKFNLIESSNGAGDIVITLSEIKDVDGYAGVTKTIVDGNQILKSFITIYQADKLTDNQIESIIRHEFGHALGLPHTSNSDDLMYESFGPTHSYISECDINALEKLYDGSRPNNDFCQS